MSRLEEIKAREAKATKGPWCIEHDAVWTGQDYAFDPQESGKRARMQAERNRIFSAHSREDIPWLIARLEQAEAALRPYQHCRHGCPDCFCVNEAKRYRRVEPSC
jgi:hypothetical protein